jgi:N-acetylneuraminic acid mutarotase
MRHTRLIFVVVLALAASACTRSSEPPTRARPPAQRGDDSVGLARPLPHVPFRTSHSAVWTGDSMLIWGGQQLSGARFMADGLIYQPGTQEWTLIPKAPLAPRADQTAVWTGSEMLVWAGGNPHLFEIVYGDGAAYNPATKRWRALPESPLSPRIYLTAVWTGRQMIAWGGGVLGEQAEQPITQVVAPGTLFNDGAAYDPITNQWTLLPKPPIKGRTGHVAVWTGREMIIWGGGGIGETNIAFKDGAAYDPATRTWRAIPEAPLAPGFGPGYTAAWDGKQMLVWGGEKGEGAAYDPATDSWTKLPDPPFGPLVLPASVWTGRVMLVWGANERSNDPSLGTAIGAAYDPESKQWTFLPRTPGATGFGQTAVWTGRNMLVWGGFNTKGPFYSGVDYRPPDRFLP